MLRKIRILLAILCFAAITLLFLDISGIMHHWLGWLPKIQLVPALLAGHWIIVATLIVVTLLLGRVYCSIVCPLGVMQDIASRLRSWIGPKKSRKNRFRYSRGLTAVRIVMLVLFVALIAAGFTSLAALIEPYSEYGRIVSCLMQPLYVGANNAIAGAMPEDSYTFYHIARNAVSLPMIIIALITLITVGAMAWFGGRIYCNTICPVGTVLGFLSRYSWLKPVINTEVCNGCGKCARGCKASCIDAKNHKIDYSRCVACMDCIDRCSTGAIRYSHRSQPDNAGKAVDGNRRTFVAMATALAGAAVVKAAEKTTDGGLAEITPKEKPERETPLVPPGAISLKNLAQHCTACQLCINKCPNNVLRPKVTLDGFMQPEMSYEQGWCRPECTVCSDVCPAGAIMPIDRARKSATQIGHAVVNKYACIAAKDIAECGNCARHCPAGAILMVENRGEGNVRIPVVDEAICIGCGSCEYHCPVSPISAITVNGHEVHKEV